MSFAHISLAFRLLVGTGWRRQRLLFFLEVGVVSLAVLGAILTLVLSHSFERAITEKLYNYLGAFWVRSFAQEVESEPRPLKRPSLNIESLSGVRVVGAVHLSVLMESAQAPYEGVQLLAVEAAWFEGMWRSALQKPLPAWQGHVAVLSERLAQRLQVKVGDEVIIAWLSDPPRFRKLKVIALYHSGMEEIDARIAFVPLEVGQALRRYAPDQVQVLHVFLASLSDFGAVLEALQENLSIDEEIVPIDYLFRDIFDWLGLIRQNVSLILSIVVGLSFFVAVSAFLVLMLTARVRFQVLRSLGMSRWGLWGLVVAQAIGVVGIGVGIGSLLAGGLLFLQAKWGWVRLDPESYLLEKVPVYWEGLPFVYVGIGAVLLAILMGVWVAPSALEAETRLSETVS
jgi:lipoprotein-releasing system permease protein